MISKLVTKNTQKVPTRTGKCCRERRKRGEEVTKHGRVCICLEVKGLQTKAHARFLMAAFNSVLSALCSEVPLVRLSQPQALQQALLRFSRPGCSSTACEVSTSTSPHSADNRMRSCKSRGAVWTRTVIAFNLDLNLLFLFSFVEYTVQSQDSFYFYNRLPNPFPAAWIPMSWVACWIFSLG